jgi:hypothetical protein
MPYALPPLLPKLFRSPSLRWLWSICSSRRLQRPPPPPLLLLLVPDYRRQSCPLRGNFFLPIDANTTRYTAGSFLYMHGLRHALLVMHTQRFVLGTLHILLVEFNIQST